MIINKIRYIESGLLKATSTITWEKDVFQKKTWQTKSAEVIKLNLNAVIPATQKGHDILQFIF